MFESKYNKLLTVILIIVVIAIIGLLGFLGFNYFSENTSTKDAEAFVNEFDYKPDDDEVIELASGIEDKKEDETEQKPTEEGSGENLLKNKNSGGSGSGSASSTSKKSYKGYTVEGTMKIPKINFSYPVLDKVTKSSIETSVAVLYGAGLNQVGNTVIIGHNYRNGQFFSNNKKLSNGDKIYITDYEGKQKTYTIYNKFETTPEDTSFYQGDTNGKAEITLSTCTDDSKARLIIFAREE